MNQEGIEPLVASNLLLLFVNEATTLYLRVPLGVPGVQMLCRQQAS